MVSWLSFILPLHNRSRLSSKLPSRSPADEESISEVVKGPDIVVTILSKSYLIRATLGQERPSSHVAYVENSTIDSLLAAAAGSNIVSA